MHAGAMAPHLSPYRDQYRSCWHCTYFAGMLYQGTVARCTRSGASGVAAQPASGRAYWVREPGADKELDPPRNSQLALVLRTERRGFVNTRSTSEKRAGPAHSRGHNWSLGAAGWRLPASHPNKTSDQTQRLGMGTQHTEARQIVRPSNMSQSREQACAMKL